MEDQKNYMCLLKLVPPKNSFTDSGGDSLHMGTSTDMLKIILPYSNAKPNNCKPKKYIK